jgi:LysM domain
MGVLSAAEHSEMDLVTVESAGPRFRLTVPVPTAGGQARPDAASRRRAGGAHSPAAGRSAPVRPEPGNRELRVRHVHVTETRVRELGTAERQEHASGPGPARAQQVRMREIRSREVRSLAVHARELGPGETSPGPRRAAGPGTARPGQAGRVRLTSRGRLVLGVFAVMVAAGLVTVFWLSVAGGAQATSHRLRPGAAYRGMTQVVVRPGQTLWSIASRAEPAADPRVVVQQIIEVNALRGAVIQPGESLWVPKG